MHSRCWSVLHVRMSDPKLCMALAARCCMFPQCEIHIARVVAENRKEHRDLSKRRGFGREGLSESPLFKTVPVHPEDVTCDHWAHLRFVTSAISFMSAAPHVLADAPPTVILPGWLPCLHCRRWLPGRTPSRRARYVLAFKRTFTNTSRSPAGSLV